MSDFGEASRRHQSNIAGSNDCDSDRSFCGLAISCHNLKIGVWTSIHARREGMTSTGNSQHKVYQFLYINIEPEVKVLSPSRNTVAVVQF